LSCSNYNPEIENDNIRVGYIYDTKTQVFTKGLNLAFLISDKDGIDDIENININDTYNKIYWDLDKSNWFFNKVDDNSAWFAFSNLKPFKYKGFDSGTYKVTVYDYSKKEANTSINIPSFNFEFQKMKIKRNIEFIKIENYEEFSDFILNYIIFDNDGNTLNYTKIDRADYKMIDLTNSFDKELNKNCKIYVYLFKEDENYFIYYGPY